MNIILYAHGYEKVGLGSLNRSVAIANHLSSFGHRVRCLYRTDRKLSPAPFEIELISPKLDYSVDLGIIGKMSQLAQNLVIVDAVNQETLSNPDFCGILSTLSGKVKTVFYDGILGDSMEVQSPSLIVDAIVRPYFHKYHSSSIPTFNGPEHFIFSKQYYSFRNRIKNNSNGKILITMGGVDHNRSTLKGLQYVAKLIESGWPGDVSIIVGPYFDFKESLHQITSKYTQMKIFEDVAHLAVHIDSADMVITNGGLTKYEAVFLGKEVGLILEPEKMFEINQAFIEETGCLFLGTTNETFNQTYYSAFEDRIVKMVQEDYQEQGSRFFNDSPRKILDHIVDEVCKK